MAIQYARVVFDRPPQPATARPGVPSMSIALAPESTAASAAIHAAQHAQPPSRPPLIRKAAVLGAGTMGSRIAAHLANAGLPVLLLDIVPANADTGNRSRIAAQALQALLKAKPAAFYEASSARLITVGNFEDDLAQLKSCDWVIEAVSEDLAIKQA